MHESQTTLKVENKLQFSPKPQQMIFNTVQSIIACHPDKIAVTVDPKNSNKFTAITSFAGYKLIITTDREGNDTTARVDLLSIESVPDAPRYRLEIKYGDKITAEFEGVARIVETHKLTEKLLENFIQGPDGTPIKFDDFYDENTVKPPEVLRILQEASTFELPTIRDAVSLKSLLEHNFKGDFILGSAKQEITQ